MLKYVYFGDVRVPTYSLVVILGVVICNIIVLLISKQKAIDYSKLIIAGILGAVVSIIGAKALTVGSQIVQGGFDSLRFKALEDVSSSFYGGLVGFLGFWWVGGRLFQVDTYTYEKEFTFIIPFLHFWWKLACFSGGCCFGIPYSGKGAVVFPVGVNELSGSGVFPIQLVEAFFSLLIAICLFVLGKQLVSPVGFFLILYGSGRFFFEFFRYHPSGLYISEAHVYSILAVVIGMILILKKKKDIVHE